MSQHEQQIRNLIKASVAAQDASAEVILFGSHARGDAHKDSDWDVLILLNRANIGRSDEQKFRHALLDVELSVGEPISTFVFSKQDWEGKHSVTPLYQSIKRDGQLL